MKRRGFTLVELLVGLVLTSVVTLSIYQVLVSSQRVHRQQTVRLELNETLRVAVAILLAELREMQADDSMESDIVALGSTSITYKAMRTLQFVCAPPTGAGASGSIVVARNPTFGLRELDVGRDSVVIFAEGIQGTREDDHWLHANVGATSVGMACTDGGPSATLTLDGVSPSGELASVTVGAPVRGYELVQVLSYTDASGDVWLGARQFTKTGGWATTQPLLGPLQAGGLEFSFFDSTGTATTTPANVAGIGVTVVGVTREPVRVGGTLERIADSLSTYVAVRNNRRG